MLKQQKPGVSGFPVSRRAVLKQSMLVGGALYALSPTLVLSEAQASSTPKPARDEALKTPKTAYIERVRKVQTVMAKRGLDALVIASQLGWPAGWDSRYLANEFPGIVVVLRHGEPVLVLNDPVAPRPRISGSWISDIRWASGSERMIEEVADYLKESHLQRSKVAIGGDVVWATRQKLSTLMPNVEIEDGNDVQDQARIIKDKYELTLIRRAAEIADEQIRTATKAIRPGRKVCEIYGDAIRTAYLLGASRGETADIPGYAPSDPYRIIGGDFKHVMKSGEVYLYEPIPFYEHYCVETVVTFALGRVPSGQQDLAKLTFESFQAAVAELKPGVPILNAVKAARGVLKPRGYSDNINGTGHFIGLANIERPPIESDPGVVLKPGMVVAIHGNLIAGEGKYKAAQGCCFEITETGKQALSKLKLEPLTQL